MIEFRKVTITEKENLIKLIDDILEKLERKDFFIPFTKNEINEFFNEDKIITYGAYDNNKIIGMAQLYIDQLAVNEIKDILKVKSNKVAELGGYLVLNDYRNKGIMKQLETILIQKAKNLDYEYIVVTVHPDNIASNKAVEYTGAKISKVTKIGEYLRNIYLLDIKKGGKND